MILKGIITAKMKKYSFKEKVNKGVKSRKN